MGGFIVEYFAWQWIFLINVPIGIVAFLVTSAVVRETRDESGTVATDIPGTIAVTGAIAALTWALIEAGERGWSDSLIVTGLAISAVLFVAFIMIEQRTAKPMVPLRFFRSPISPMHCVHALRVLSPEYLQLQYCTLYKGC